jgi:hypothetical protein
MEKNVCFQQKEFHYNRIKYKINPVPERAVEIPSQVAFNSLWLTSTNQQAYLEVRMYHLIKENHLSGNAWCKGHR